ncbi:MAG: hypothetical protein C0407_09865 [Desulfobacca sp.]|nr:hypothetical protein [Desulfobacca sp.]
MNKVHRDIIELLKEKQGGRLLDLACGSGQLGAALEEKGFRVFFADRYDLPSNPLRCIKMDLKALPFKNKVFDFIVCAESLQYMENHEIFFSEMRRLLVSNGAMVVSFPNVLTVSERLYFFRRGWSSCFKPIRGKNPSCEWANVVYHVFSFVDIFQLLKKNSFVLLKVVSPDMSWKSGWLYPILRGFYRLGLFFDNNLGKTQLIRWMMSKEVLRGDHLILYSLKKPDTLNRTGHVPPSI